MLPLLLLLAGAAALTAYSTHPREFLQAIGIHQHTFGDWAVAKAPGCETTGREERSCACGETESRTLAALGHSYEVIQTIAPTYETEGCREEQCTRCGNVFREKTADPLDPIPVSSLQMEWEEQKEYDRTPFFPEVTITHNGIPLLEEDSLYSITYAEGSTDIGVYTAVITMKGMYSGSKTIKYSVLPPSTTLFSGRRTITSATFCWESREGIDGYELQYAREADFSDAVTEEWGAEETVRSFPELPENTQYFVRIRTICHVGEERLASVWSPTEELGTCRVVEEDGITYIDGVLIANKTYSLPSWFGSGTDSKADNAFSDMQRSASSDGISLWVVSGYRSYSLQDYLFRRYSSERGQEAAERVSARPGHSEHQTGLAFDVNTTSAAFAGTPEAQWLAENCWRFGFVVRYPEEKEDITGYSYEPWHIRYVGAELAAELYENNWTLEEYFGISSSYAD